MWKTSVILNTILLISVAVLASDAAPVTSRAPYYNNVNIPMNHGKETDIRFTGSCILQIRRGNWNRCRLTDQVWECEMYLRNLQRLRAAGEFTHSGQRQKRDCPVRLFFCQQDSVLWTSWEKEISPASGTGHIFCAATSLERDQASLATLEGGQLHPLLGVHKTVTTASSTVQLPPSNVAKLGHVGGR